MVAIRQSRVVIALIAIFSVLFMQLAVAGYVCPQFEPVAAERMTAALAADDASMLPCHEMDEEAPSLCSAHAQEGRQSLDKPELPSIQQFNPASLAGTIMPIKKNQSLSSAALEDSFLLTRANAPPLAIQHCCFRI